MKSRELKEYEWREKRRGKITASVLPDLMQKGKGSLFGTKAIDAMFAIRYERRTGIIRESTSSKATEWGNQNEPLAIEWLRSEFVQPIESCSEDFDDIVFNETLPGFGDSPDAYMYDFEGVRNVVIEIKCPISQSKIEALFYDLSHGEKHFEFIKPKRALPQKTVDCMTGQTRMFDEFFKD